jgi:hypothetical protein
VGDVQQFSQKLSFCISLFNADINCHNTREFVWFGILSIVWDSRQVVRESIFSRLFRSHKIDCHLNLLTWEKSLWHLYTTRNFEFRSLLRLFVLLQSKYCSCRPWHGATVFEHPNFVEVLTSQNKIIVREIFSSKRGFHVLGSFLLFHSFLLYSSSN